MRGDDGVIGSWTLEWILGRGVVRTLGIEEDAELDALGQGNYFVTPLSLP